MVKPQTLEIGSGKSAGYTLLELIIVLSIMATLAAVGFRYLSNSGSSSANYLKLSSTLYADLVGSQARARMGGHSKVFQVSSDNDAYTTSDGAKVSLPEGVSVAIYSNMAGSAVEKIDIIEFFSWGGSSGGLVVLSDAEKRTEFHVDWLTGAVRQINE